MEVWPDVLLLWIRHCFPQGGCRGGYVPFFIWGPSVAPSIEKERKIGEDGFHWYHHISKQCHASLITMIFQLSWLSLICKGFQSVVTLSDLLLSVSFVSVMTGLARCRPRGLFDSSIIVFTDSPRKSSCLLYGYI